MNTKIEWFSITSEQNYNVATARYEEIKHSPKGSDQHKEKLLLITLIVNYEKAQWDLPELDFVEFNKIRVKDYGSNT